MCIHTLTRHSLFAFCCLLVGSLLAACAANQAGQSSQVSLAGPPPLPLSNPSPTQLTLFVRLQIGGYDATTRDQTTLSFLFSSQGHAVRFAGNEQLTCNGNAVSLHPQTNDIQLTGPTSTLAGQTQHCTYRSGSKSQTSATFTFTVPQTPTITTPQEQARLPRSKTTRIVYDTHGETPMGLVALGSPGKAIAQLNTPGTGQATVDTSAFPAGPGSLGLTEEFAIPITQSTPTNTPFASLQVRADAIVSVNVTWI